MAKKKKENITPNNLVLLREDQGLTQESLAELLDVVPEMIGRYENLKSDIPIDKALLLSKKYNYSLDWIYKNYENNLDRKKLKNYSEEYCLKFLVDIRDFISYSDDKITLSINNAYWEYIKNVNEINCSKKTSKEKLRAIAELNGDYRIDNNKSFSWTFSTDITMMDFGNGQSCIYASENPNDLPQTSEEKIKEATDFLHLLTTATDNE